MKKFLLSSLIIFMISMIGAQTHFFDMRMGDFGCITRVVLEFTGKVQYTAKENDKNLEINLSSLKDTKIVLPPKSSNNISEIQIIEDKRATSLSLDFIFPIEVNSYAYFKENDNYIIVFDIYDKDYHINKEKGLATLLYKGQKFSIKKIESDINDFSAKYPNDPLVNLYLGRLYSTSKDMKTKAIEYFSRIHPSSNNYFTAKAYIGNLERNKFPTDEVKPDFLNRTSSLATLEEENSQLSDSIYATQASDNTSIVTSSDIKSRRGKDKSLKKQNTTHKDKNKSLNTVNNKSQSSIFLTTGLIVSLLITLVLFFKNYKKNIQLKQLHARLENSEFELQALANKLEKGIIENSKTKDRMIIKLFNSGWKPEDIAQELNTSIDIINATINKEGRL